MKPFVPEPLPIKNIGWKELVPDIGRANRALATFEGIMHGIPNPNVLLSPLTTQEAVMSSKIEGTRTNLEEVLKYDAGEKITDESRRQDVQEVVNYRRALREAEFLLKKRPFNLNMLKRFHEILMDSVRGHDKGKGRLRTIQNWIGRKGTSIETAEYVPPAPLSIMEHLGRWERYYHEDEPDPLVQLAVVHAQFEIIHPFVDGNGRIGRMLVPLFLFEKGLLSRPTFYLSSFFERERGEYVGLLRGITRTGGWTGWIKFFLGAISVQAKENTDKARNIQELYERLKKRSIGITHSQYAVPVLDQIFRQPIFNSKFLVSSKGMPSTPMLMTILNRMSENGVLKVIQRGRGRRPQIFALREQINLCEGRKVF